MRSVTRHLFAFVLLVSLAVPGCDKTKKDDKEAPTTDPTDSPAPGASIESTDIMERTKVATKVDVKHVLIGWKDLADAYGGRIDKRAKDRTKAEADKLAVELRDKLKAAPASIDALVKQHSEDPGSLSGDPYTVEPSTGFVPEFKKLALRLEVGEVGIVKTKYGYHVMLRVAPAPPDPLASSDILAREGGTDTVYVKHVLIGWKDVPAGKQAPLDPRAKERSKADADTLAKSVLDKIRAGGDIDALMKEHSEDPGSKDNARAYDVNPGSQMVPTFKDLALRLELDEAGMVISPFGWHVMKRVAPPPPDNLESADILARTEVADKTKVKHILLGWDAANAGDPRGAKRTRAELEKLVKKTVAELKKGKPIEPLMAKLSEDPGSAKSGNSYDASPNASLVPPFKALSLRLKKDEVGVVKTQFGIHIIKRVE